MQNEHYPLKPDKGRTTFGFESIGHLGTIKKSIVFEQVGIDLWNLAFGDLTESGRIDDEVVSNNGDLIRVLSTVVQATVQFSNLYPYRKISIRPVDEKRKQLYNTIFRRHFESFDKMFLIYGDAGAGLKRSAPNLDCEQFLLIRRNA